MLLKLNTTFEIPPNHGDCRPGAPSQLSAFDVLPNGNLPAVSKLIPNMQQSMHEGQVQAVFQMIFKLSHGVFVAAPFLQPCRFAKANICG
jgi:hypothetical protein